MLVQTAADGYLELRHYSTTFWADVPSVAQLCAQKQGELLGAKVTIRAFDHSKATKNHFVTQLWLAFFAPK
jgi:hypothetical protein